MKCKKTTVGCAYKYLIALAAGTLFTCICAHADVFWRWGAAKNIERLIVNIGGKQTYSADIDINGAPGHVSVFGFKDPNNHWRSAMHSVTLKSADILTTLLAVQLKEAPLLFKIERPANVQDSGHHQLKEIPSYPQSIQAFYARDKESNLSMSVSKSNSSPAEVRAFYRNALASEGWLLTTQATENSSSGMSAYIRENEVACVAADRAKISGETRITLVYKKLGIK